LYQRPLLLLLLLLLLVLVLVMLFTSASSLISSFLFASFYFELPLSHPGKKCE